MTERAYRFGDPAKVYEMEEARTCKGCCHTIKTLFHGQGVQQVFQHCGKGRTYGKRCKHYLNPTEKGTA